MIRKGPSDRYLTETLNALKIGTVVTLEIELLYRRHLSNRYLWTRALKVDKLMIDFKKFGRSFHV